MPWLRDTLVSDRKPGCYGGVGYHGTHGHQNYYLGLNHMENGGLDRETGQEFFGQCLLQSPCMAEVKSLLSSIFV